jgi:hypothetical protein
VYHCDSGSSVQAADFFADETGVQCLSGQLGYCLFAAPQIDSIHVNPVQVRSVALVETWLSH